MKKLLILIIAVVMISGCVITYGLEMKSIADDAIDIATQAADNINQLNSKEIEQDQFCTKNNDLYNRASGLQTSFQSIEPPEKYETMHNYMGKALDTEVSVLENIDQFCKTDDQKYLTRVSEQLREAESLFEKAQEEFSKLEESGEVLKFLKGD